MYDPTPPLFDPLGEGVDVSDIEASTGSGAAGTATTLKGGHKAKVSAFGNAMCSVYYSSTIEPWIPGRGFPQTIRCS